MVFTDLIHVNVNVNPHKKEGKVKRIVLLKCNPANLCVLVFVLFEKLRNIFIGDIHKS